MGVMTIPVNEIIHGDCLEVMRGWPGESIGVVVTSPPYNLRNSTGGGATGPGKHSKWSRPGTIVDASYDGYSDDLPEDEYQPWLLSCMNEVVRLLKPDGAAFVVFKNRVQNGAEQTRSWVWSQLPVRQTLVWARHGGLNVNKGYFVPTHELIYFITKPGFKVQPGAWNLGTVWKIAQSGVNSDRIKWHPAPFPIELAERCIRACPDNGPILDPFMGSGTTAVAAGNASRDWVGIEQSLKYVTQANERIQAAHAAPMLL